MQGDSNPSGWVKVFHPSGVQVTVPLDLNVPVSSDQAATLLESVSNLLHAGFSVYAPGLEDGENYEQVAFAVRREKENDNADPTPVIDLYPVNGNFRLLAVYLNQPADLQAFEAATGLTLSKMPMYEGTNTIERGAVAKLDKYVVALKSPVKIVWKANPKYDPNEQDIKKKKPRRLFVRWADLAAAQSEQADAKQTMSIEQAGAVLTPGGKPFSDLTAEQLAQLANSKAQNVTDEMRTAAFVILEASKQGAR